MSIIGLRLVPRPATIPLKAGVELEAGMQSGRWITGLFAES
jgi:hypothetical protein